MEDMARLALVEQNVRDGEKFSKILHELLRFINNIFENPYDIEFRKIKSNILKEMCANDWFTNYLNYVGFEKISNEYVYPIERTLSNLRVTQVAIERKVSFCGISANKNSSIVKPIRNVLVPKKDKLTPDDVLTTRNPFLQKIQTLFNDMLKYEDEELLSLAREHIPIVKLQLMALDRVREQQKGLKTGDINGHDLAFDIALLMELLGWFKNKFFTWVDKPDCELCAGATTLSKRTTMVTEAETCIVELYKCTVCEGGSKFPRHNDLRTLLRTRRGRCGEWANCFTLICRAMGYDTRYVYDVTDHVWCEIFDYDSNSWVHVDPCEAAFNAPLLYCHGWGKQLSYVIAFSRDDLQDVTWRYTMNHKEVLQRRSLVDEIELVSTILELREHRQSQVSEPRRKYLAKRAAEELVQLMVERKPQDYESQGRLSGSIQWRMERGESGPEKPSHVFTFTQPGSYAVRYHSSTDKYRLTHGASEYKQMESWASGVYECKNIFRKVEKDWRQVYLAREAGEEQGSISWKLVASGDTMITYLCVKLSSAIYESGKIDWWIAFDGKDPEHAILSDVPTEFDRRFKDVIITAKLSGGVGDVAWQHAQLFRQTTDSTSSAFDVQVIVE